MKKIATTLGLMAVSLALANAQTILWTFEVNPPDASGTTITGLIPAIGTGTGSGVHASAATVWSNPVGNGSSESFSSNNWAIGDYYQFTGDLSAYTVAGGFTGVTFTFDMTRSSSGPADWSLLYSVNGTDYTSFDTFTVAANTWSSISFNEESTYTFDLSAVSGLLGNSSASFRIQAESAPGSTGGTARVDDVTIAAIPEPGTIALVGIGLTGLLWGMRRRRVA